MSTITVVGVDLAKRSFHVYGVDEGVKRLFPVLCLVRNFLIFLSIFPPA